MTTHETYQNKPQGRSERQKFCNSILSKKMSTNTRLPGLMKFCSPSRVEYDDSDDDEEGLQKARSMTAENSFITYSESTSRSSASSRDMSFVTPEAARGSEKLTDQDGEMDTTEFDAPAEPERPPYVTAHRFVLLLAFLLMGLIVWKNSVDCDKISSELRTFPASAMVAPEEISDHTFVEFELNQSLNATVIPESDTLTFYKLQSDASGSFLTSCAVSVQLSKREEGSILLACT